MIWEDGTGILTVDESVENELPVLLDEVVDVTKNSTIQDIPVSIVERGHPSTSLSLSLKTSLNRYFEAIMSIRDGGQYARFGVWGIDRR